MIHDSSLGDVKPAKSRSQRQVYQHDIHSRDVRQVYSHDIDTDVTYRDIHPIQVSMAELEVYNASYDQGPHLSKDQFLRLPPEARTKWDELSPESKHIILEAKNWIFNHPRPPRKSNIHEITRSDLDDVAAYDFIQVHLHELQAENPPSAPLTLTAPSDASSVTHPDARTLNDDDSRKLLAHLTKRNNLWPGDLQRVLSSSINKPKTTIPAGTASHDITINGKTYRQVNMAKTIYVASDHRTVRRGALVDRGANNGGIAGDDVQGIDNHQIIDIPIVTAGVVVSTQRGDVIIIMHQYAWTKKGKTIHSSRQLEWYKQDVDDKSRRVGGKQRIKTIDGYYIPINIQSGLPYVGQRPYTNDGWDTLPHVVLTGDTEWHPSVLDNNLDDNDWYDALQDLPEDLTNQLFDQFGNYRHQTIVNRHVITPSILENYILSNCDFLYQVHERKIQPATIDYSRYHTYFAWLLTEIIKKTFENTTQHATLPMSTSRKPSKIRPNMQLCR
jgi:hypothetical protein